MKMIKWILVMALVLVWGPALAASDVVAFDFKGYIAQHLQERERFAAPVDADVDAARAGDWSVQQGHAVWRYEVAVPGASSLGFYADTVQLPSGAALSVASQDAPQVYRDDDWKSGSLWSRTAGGDVLTLELTLPGSNRSGVHFHLAQLQAGYRALSPNQRNHPAYDQALKSQAAAPTTPDACDQNFECFATSANQDLANAAVAVIISNQEACSGTLMSDTANDYRPFILTAFHCLRAVTATGSAVGYQFYWNATKPCGQTLDYVTNDAKATSSGATLRAQYQDALLIEASAAPPYGAVPYWAGWDASDTFTTTSGTQNVLTGALYGVHHANTWDRQYVSAQNATQDNHQASSSPDGTQYYDDWVIQLGQSAGGSGEILGGASGSFLAIASTNRVIGSLTSASLGSCTASTTNPNGGSADDTVYYQRLGRAWAGTGTSSGSLQFWLDAAGTGALTSNGSYNPARQGKPVVTLSVSPAAVAAGQTVTVSWSATLTSACTLSGDLVATSTLHASGSLSVFTDNASPGAHGFSMSCTSENNEAGTGQASLTVTGAAGSSSSGGSSSGSSGGSSSSSSASSSSSSSGAGSSSSSSGSSGAPNCNSQATGCPTGGGGGGAFGFQTLLALAAMGGWRRRRRSGAARI